MSSFKKAFDELWEAYPTLFSRPEMVVDHLFIQYGIGRMWKNGVFSSIGKRKAKPTTLLEEIEETLARCFLPNEREAYEKKFCSMLDYYTEMEREISSLDNFAFSNSSSDYCALKDFPDDITKDWAKAILLCCDWVDSVSWECFYNQHRDSMVRMYFGSMADREKEIAKKNPKKSIEEVRQILIEEIEIKVDSCLEKDFKLVKTYSKDARKRINKLFPKLTPHKMPKLKRVFEKPSFYVGQNS